MLKCGVLVLVLAVFSGGCWWFPGPGKAGRELLENGASVQIYKPGSLALGGAVAVEAFRAGERAEASVVLDRLALGIYKGCAEGLMAGTGGLAFFDEQQGQVPAFSFSGRVEEFRRPGFMARLAGRRHAVILVRAELRDLPSGDLVAVVRLRRRPEDTAERLQWESVDIGTVLVRDLAAQAQLMSVGQGEGL